jgi:hypothetical protein
MFYTYLLPMPWRKPSLLLLFALCVAVPCLYAAKKVYLTGKFLDIQQKSKDRVDMYLVNTPVTTAVPYFEVTVELGDTDYVAEYTPRHDSEELPEAWKSGTDVKARVEKHHLFLQRSDGTEMPWIITKRKLIGKAKFQD